MPSNAPLQGVILDVDGTLVDSNDQHAQSWMDAFAEHGIEVPYEPVRRAIGMGSDNFLPTVLHLEKDTDLGKQLSRRRSEIFKERYQPQVRPFPQADTLLRRMHDVGLTLIIASSGEEDEVKAMLSLLGVSDLIDVLTTSADVSSSKPAPDPIQVALDKAGLSPDAVVMLGDTPYDIESAGKAGVGTIAVRCGGWREPDLSEALAVYNDPADLLAHFDESPLERHR